MPDPADLSRQREAHSRTLHPRVRSGLLREWGEIGSSLIGEGMQSDAGGGFIIIYPIVCSPGQDLSRDVRFQSSFSEERY